MSCWLYGIIVWQECTTEVADTLYLYWSNLLPCFSLESNVDLLAFSFSSYALDVNVERAEDVLTHKKLLELAQEPANRPVFAVRLVQVRVSTALPSFEHQILIINSKSIYRLVIISHLVLLICLMLYDFSCIYCVASRNFWKLVLLGSHLHLLFDFCLHGSW